MTKEIEEWIRNFDNEVASIEIEFNAYFTNGRIRDYFRIEFDQTSQTPLIHFYEVLDLPKHVQADIINALQRTKPKQLD